MAPRKRKAIVAETPRVLPPVLTPAKRRELRQKLLLLYIATPVQPPVLTETLKRMEFLGVPYKTAQEWKLEDEWDRRREEFQKALFAQMVQRVGDRMAQTTLAMVEEIAPLRERLRLHLARVQFDDASSDKLIAAYVKVMELQARLTEQATGLLTPGPNGAEVQDDGNTRGDARVGTLTIEEAREAGLAILRARRAAAALAAAPAAAQPAQPAGGPGPAAAADAPGGVPRK